MDEILFWAILVIVIGAILVWLMSTTRRSSSRGRRSYDTDCYWSSSDADCGGGDGGGCDGGD